MVFVCFTFFFLPFIFRDFVAGADYLYTDGCGVGGIWRRLKTCIYLVLHSLQTNAQWHF
jgi:hypothetical protein